MPLYLGSPEFWYQEGRFKVYFTILVVAVWSVLNDNSLLGLGSWCQWKKNQIFMLLVPVSVLGKAVIIGAWEGGTYAEVMAIRIWKREKVVLLVEYFYTLPLTLLTQYQV